MMKLLLPTISSDLSRSRDSPGVKKDLVSKQRLWTTRMPTAVQFVAVLFDIFWNPNWKLGRHHPRYAPVSRLARFNLALRHAAVSLSFGGTKRVEFASPPWPQAVRNTALS
ncbi:hypothetical protein CIHG_05556 [Coccidioides immitis H538.4]|uniref:Uncharacterized protein n=1 Tax=Coccidioides immitis H538.4 TaxID=396776 RepID=A0A0J8RSQ4_COCIT|nr:hypothetical protein CIHG_05556 [Coccidioides immitis H538.4]